MAEGDNGQHVIDSVHHIGRLPPRRSGVSCFVRRDDPVIAVTANRREVMSWTGSPTWAAPRVGAPLIHPASTSRSSPEPWQGRAFALTLLSIQLAGWNVDAFRHAMERLDRRAYLDDGYYGRWLNAAELMLTESAVLAPARDRGPGPQPAR